MTTTTPTCDLVADRVALGEPLDAALTAHVAACAACTRLTALPALLGATHHAADPGIGFSARITGGAQRRLVVRRRRRIAGALAASVATAAIAVFAMTRPSPELAAPVAVQTPPTPTTPTPTTPTPAPSTALDHAVDHVTPAEPTPSHSHAHRAADADVRTLVHLADLDRSTRMSARWDRIESGLVAYRPLVDHGGTP